MDGAGVFQLVNELAGAFVAQHRRSGKGEGKVEFATIGTLERFVDASLERLAAFFTKRRGEPWQVPVAGIAQRTAVLEDSFTQRALRGIDEVEQAVGEILPAMDRDEHGGNLTSPVKMAIQKWARSERVKGAAIRTPKYRRYRWLNLDRGRHDL